MIFTKKILAATTLCMLSAVSFAETKVAVLNPEAAILSTAIAKAKFEKLEKTADFAATKAKLDGISADIKSLQEAYKKDGVTWSAEKKQESEKKLQSLQEDGQFNAKKLQSAKQAVAQEIGEEVGQKYQAALKQLIESEKIGVLLNSQAALYIAPENDVTAKVTDLINKAK